MWPLNLTLKAPSFIICFYTATCFSDEGAIALWKQRDPKWRYGFVARFLWLGFFIRTGKKTLGGDGKAAIRRRNYTRRLEAAIQQANDGDYAMDDGVNYGDQ